MVWLPQVRRVAWDGEVGDVYLVGHRLIDDFLQFAGGRARPNTVRAYAHDLKTFFSVVAKDPIDVRAEDVFGFITAQQEARVGAENVARISDGGSGLSAATVRRRRTAVSAFYGYLIARGDVGVDTNPVPRGLPTRRRVERSCVGVGVQHGATINGVLNGGEIGEAHAHADAHTPLFRRGDVRDTRRHRQLLLRPAHSRHRLARRSPCATESPDDFQYEPVRIVDVAGGWSRRQLITAPNAHNKRRSIGSFDGALENAHRCRRHATIAPDPRFRGVAAGRSSLRIGATSARSALLLTSPIGHRSFDLRIVPTADTSALGEVERAVV